jgi:hypothetical protein
MRKRTVLPRMRLVGENFHRRGGSVVRNRKYGYRERKEVDVCPSDLKEEELLDLSEGGGRVFIDERL